VAIANALQLEASRATTALSCFNHDAMPSLTSLNLSIAVSQRFVADTLLYAVTLTFDLEHCVTCSSSSSSSSCVHF